jgi:hypothetical protein
LTKKSFEYWFSAKVFFSRFYGSIHRSGGVIFSLNTEAI